MAKCQDCEFPEVADSFVVCGSKQRRGRCGAQERSGSPFV